MVRTKEAHCITMVQRLFFGVVYNVARCVL